MQTIRSSREIDAMFATASKVSHPFVLALVAPAALPSGGRVCFVAGKRLGGAVVRNRMKRLLREALRRAGGQPETRDIVLIARPGLASASPAAVDAAFASVLERARTS
jgi:ribonuclease P protein component